MSARVAKAASRPIVLEEPETSPWARIRALEEKLVDVERRHGDAIALLCQFIAERAGEESDAAEKKLQEADRISIALDELVPDAAARLRAVWRAEAKAVVKAEEAGA